MFTILMMVHAKDRNGDGFNLLLHPVNEQAEPYGFFLQSPPTGALTALVNNGMADQLEIGVIVEVTIKPAEQLAERKDVNASTSNSSAGDSTDGGQGVADVAADRPRRGRAG